jgi:endo-1,4-beta-xylanase
MISLIRLAAFLLPVAGSLAAPTSAPVSDVQDAPRKSDAFYEQMRAIINNSTAHEEAELQKRAAGSFSTSQDGVNSAGFYYSLYNDNKAGATYTEYNSGRFALTWNAKAEFLGGKGYKGDTPK